MPKTYPVRNSFNAGEVSELINFRDDIQKYSSSCRVLENAVPLVEGGAKKMPGTYFAGSTGNGGAMFTASIAGTTMTVTAVKYGVLRVGQKIVGVGVASGTTVSAYGTGTGGTGNYTITPTQTVSSETMQTASNGKSRLATFQFSTEQGAILEFSAGIVRIWEGASQGQWSLGLALSGGVPVQVVTPYQEQDLFALDVSTQSADVIYIAHHNYPLASINRVSANNWTYTVQNLYGTNSPISTGFNSIASYITSITQASPALLTVYSVNAPFGNGDKIYINGCAGMQDLNAGQFYVANFGGSSGAWTFNLLPLSSQGGGPVGSLSCGYGGTFSSDPSGTYVATGGTGTGLTVVVSGTQVYTGVWVISSVSPGSPGTGYLVGDNPTISVLSQTVPVTVTSISASGEVDSTNFLAYQGGGYAVLIPQQFNTVGNFPSCCSLYQQRFYLGGSDDNPTQLNGSVEGDYPDFICDPNLDDYAIQYKLVSNQVNQLLNMLGTPNALLLGTSGGVWVIQGSNGSSSALSQTNVSAVIQSTQGVSALQPQLVNGSAIFVSRSTRIVTFLLFSFVSNTWENIDLTRLNRSITIGASESLSGIAQTAFQMEPYPIFWAARNDGQLLGLVFNTQDQVFAWFRINMIPEGGYIESAAVITGSGQEDQLVVVVNRTVNGVVQRYVEYFMPQEIFGQLSNAFFVHSGQQLQGVGPFAITGITNANPPVVAAPGHTFTNGMTVQISQVNGMVSPTGQSINQGATEAYTVNGVSGNTFELQGMDTSTWTPYVSGGSVSQVFNHVTGMSYLIGNTVVAVGDGAVILQPTEVNSDEVDFPYYANLITIGIPYETTIQPTNPVLNSQGATSRGMPQKLNRVTLSLYQSMGGQYGEDLGHMYDITYGSGAMANTPQMSTAEFTRDMDCDWTEESTFIVRQSDPLPFTLRGIVFRMSANQD